MRTSGVILAALFGVAASAAPPSTLAQQREVRQRTILVSAVTATGTPVPALTAADLIVREDGIAREIISVAAAPPPSHMAVLIDDSQAIQDSLADVRAGVSTFITRVAEREPAPHIAVWTFGERPTRRADFSPAARMATDAARSIFPQTGSGAYFLQAVRDATTDLGKRTTSHPVIVAFVAENGPEFSSFRHTDIATALREAGASLWAVALQERGQPFDSPEARERALVLGKVVDESGGRTTVVLSGQAVRGGLETTASLLATRHLVTYGRPDSMIPPTAVEVTAKRPDVRVRATTWAAR
jgi:hypothetical protein